MTPQPSPCFSPSTALPLRSGPLRSGPLRSGPLCSGPLCSGPLWRDHFRVRNLIIVLDDLDSAERAVLVAPARGITPTQVNEMLTLSGGLTFVAITPTRAQALALEPMRRARSTPPTGPRMCVSVEAREGVTTGISASDRALTIALLGDPLTHSRTLVSPGHIFPIEVEEGGVLIKSALPEAARDVVTLAFESEGALFMDLLDHAGEHVTSPAVLELATSLRIPIITLSELIRDRLVHEKLVVKVAEAKLPTTLAGELRALMYRSTIYGGEHVVLIKGAIEPEVPTLIRVQPERTFDDVFGRESLSTRAQLNAALRAIGERGRGVIVYLRRAEIGSLREQVMHRQLSSQLSNTERDSEISREKRPDMMREYGLGAQVLRDVGVSRAEVLSTRAHPLIGLDSFGIEIVGTVPLVAEPAPGLSSNSVN